MVERVRSRLTDREYVTTLAMMEVAKFYNEPLKEAKNIVESRRSFYALMLGEQHERVLKLTANIQDLSVDTEEDADLKAAMGHAYRARTSLKDTMHRFRPNKKYRSILGVYDEATQPTAYLHARQLQYREEELEQTRRQEQRDKVGLIEHLASVQYHVSQIFLYMDKYAMKTHEQLAKDTAKDAYNLTRAMETDVKLIEEPL